jgi:hypothetical protein
LNDFRHWHLQVVSAALHPLTSVLHTLRGRWVTYNALLAVATCSFSSFMGSLVLHRKVTVELAAVLSIVTFFLPLLNVAALFCRYGVDKAGPDLLWVVFGSCDGSLM